MELTAAGSRADWPFCCDDNSGADVSLCKPNGRYRPPSRTFPSPPHFPESRCSAAHFERQ